MPLKTFRQAINDTLVQEMQRDMRIILIGEDIAGGTGCEGDGDAWGGPLGVTKGLISEFGPDRVLDTPISEAAFMGAAVGAAMNGLRPVVDLMFNDFVSVCFDQVCNQAAKCHYMYGGQNSVPMTIRANTGAGISTAAQHSQSLHPVFSFFPGLKVVVPTSPYEAKGLLTTAIRDDDPVIFLETKLLYDMEEDVPDESYEIPFGEANILREGGDVTIVAVGRMVHVATEASAALARKGIECEIIDPRTTSPLDTETILESVEETGRLVIVDETTPRCNFATDVSAMVAQEGFAFLKAPIRMVTAPHTPIPFAPNLEQLYMPDPAKVSAAVQQVVGYQG